MNPKPKRKRKAIKPGGYAIREVSSGLLVRSYNPENGGPEPVAVFPSPETARLACSILDLEHTVVPVRRVTRTVTEWEVM